MSVKQKLLEQIAAIQAQLAHCSCDDESPVFKPEEDEDYYVVHGVGSDGTGVDRESNYSGTAFEAFRTEDAANAFANAFGVMLKLRAQKGVVPLKHGTWQFLVEARGDGSVLEVRKRRDGGVKQSRSFSPVFDTAEAAQAAITAVGKDNIVKAQKTLAWVA